MSYSVPRVGRRWGAGCHHGVPGSGRLHAGVNQTQNNAQSDGDGERGDGPVCPEHCCGWGAAQRGPPDTGPHPSRGHEVSATRSCPGGCCGDVDHPRNERMGNVTLSPASAPRRCHGVEREHRTIAECPAAPARARPGAHMGTGAADRLLSPLWLPTPNPLATFRLPRGHRRKGVPRAGAGAAGAQPEVGAGLCRAKAPPGAASAPLEPCPEGGPGLRSPLPCWRWSLGSGQQECRVQQC